MRRPPRKAIDLVESVRAILDHRNGRKHLEPYNFEVFWFHICNSMPTPPPLVETIDLGESFTPKMIHLFESF